MSTNSTASSDAAKTKKLGPPSVANCQPPVHLVKSSRTIRRPANQAPNRLLITNLFRLDGAATDAIGCCNAIHELLIALCKREPYASVADLLGEGAFPPSDIQVYSVGTDDPQINLVEHLDQAATSQFAPGQYDITGKSFAYNLVDYRVYFYWQKPEVTARLQTRAKLNSPRATAKETPARNPISSSIDDWLHARYMLRCGTFCQDLHVVARGTEVTLCGKDLRVRKGVKYEAPMAPEELCEVCLKKQLERESMAARDNVSSVENRARADRLWREMMGEDI